MRPIVNLARQPFRNRRLFWLAILAAFGVTSYFGLNAVSEKVRLERELLQQQEALNRLLPKAAPPNIKKPDAKESQSALTITADKNRELLAAGELIERRAFSWSQLLNDIEHHIPATVRVVRIAVNKVKAKNQNPNTEAKGEDRTVNLTLEVIGKGSTDVTKMMTDFERTGVFKINPRESKLLEGTTEVQFTLDAEYTPPTPRGLRAMNNQLAENRK